MDVKLSKAKDTLFDLQKEIKTTLTYLEQLWQCSSAMVEKLCNTSSPTTCLNEFAKVNSFLLRYISFVTEINCKFEMLQMFYAENYSSANFKLKQIKGTEDDNSLDDVLVNSLEVLPNTEPQINKIFFNHYKNTNFNSMPTNNHEPVNIKNSGSYSANSLIELSTSQEDESLINSGSLVQKDSKLVLNDNIKSYVPTESLKSSINFSETVQSCDPQATELKPSLSLSPNESSTKHKVKLDNLSVPNSPEAQSTPILEEIKNTSTHEEKENIKLCTKEIESKVSVPENKNEIQGQNNNLEECEILPLSFSRRMGEKYKVAVEHIKSPSEFYVHFLDSKFNNRLELENILKSIPLKNFKIKNKTSEDKKCFLKNKLGSYVLYYSKIDEFWCRGMVTDWDINHRHGNLVQIFLLDYGESKCVHLDSLRPMPKYLKKYPAFAVRCHLFGILPVDTDAESKLVWSKQSVEKMKSIIETSEDINIQIFSDKDTHDTESLSVILWLVDQEHRSVNKLLVERNHAILKSSIIFDSGDTVSNSQDLENEILEKWDPMKEDFNSYQNCYDVNINDPAAAIYGYVGRDCERICSQFSRTGKCFKGKSCRKEHTFLDPLGFTTDQEEVFKEAFNSLPIPFVGNTFRVQVTDVSEINNFYCISNELNLHYDEENLDSLIAFMNSKENNLSMRKLSIPPSVGQLVIAKYSGDNHWYRAKILESQPEKDEYTILYVDFGNTEELPLSQMRAMEARYLHLPFQAISCFIYGIQVNPDNLVDDALNYLNKKMYEENISIEVISTLPGNELRLFVKVFDNNGRDIGKILIAKGYAIPKEELNVSSDCDIIPG